MLWQWPFALIHYGHGYAAVKRVQGFLLNKEMRRCASGCVDGEQLNRFIFPRDDTKAVSLTNITSNWKAGANRTSGIYNSSLNVASGELCAIIGPVGSGLYDATYT